MKKILSIAIVLCLFFSLAACNNEPSVSNNFDNCAKTPSGYMLEVGIPCTIEGYLTYEVIEYDGEMTSVVEQAETLVRNWWNDDATFTSPNIIWCNVLEGNVRGFQDKGYLFLSPYASRDDLLATAVHEWLHDLVSKYTLVNKDDDLGREVMEMIIETITVDILNGIVEVIPTDGYHYFKRTDELWKHKHELIAAFRRSAGFEAYEQILGKDYLRILLEAHTALSY